MARIQEEIDQIRAIGVPQGDEGQVKAALDEAKQVLDSVKANPAQLADQSADPFGKANQLLNAYGMTVCAKQ
jgi:hypothetical protein